VSLPRHIRDAGLRAIEDKLAQIASPSLDALRERKKKELGSPLSAPIPKVVNFPSS
jgi:hypothetical protein